MYTKKLCFKKYLPQYDSWVESELRVTNDSFWIHFNALSINNNIKEIVVKDI